jgi:hypothetical protein
MEIIIAIVALAIIVYIGYKVLNAEKADGSHPLDAATQAPYKVEPPVVTKMEESIPVQPTISNVLDVNGDGKVNLEDAKEAVKKTVKKAKAVMPAKKSAGKKPAVKKPVTKKAKK